MFAKTALVCMLVFLPASGAVAGDILLCWSKDRLNMTVTLDLSQFKGRQLSCVSGAFIKDLTPCAPEGAYALSAPTGTAAIVDVVERWQDYANHDGGVFNFTRTPTDLIFDAGFNRPDKGFHEAWMFQIDRISGTAVLSVTNEASTVYHCNKVKPKF